MKGKLFNLLTMILCFFTSCSSNNNPEPYKTPGQQANELQAKIMECFINKDKETLKSFFSDYVLENCTDIDSQIEKAFNLIDGEFVSYDEPSGSACGPSHDKAYGSETRNIITDKGTKYRIGFTGFLTNEREPKRIGIRVLVVANITKRESSSYDEWDMWTINIGDY